jgi:hypothetical protein
MSAASSRSEMPKAGLLRIISDLDPRPDWITSEMIDVGALILVEYGGLGPYTAGHLAEDAYRAMAAHAPNAQPKRDGRKRAQGPEKLTQTRLSPTM